MESGSTLLPPQRDSNYDTALQRSRRAINHSPKPSQTTGVTLLPNALTQTNKHSKCWLPSYRADPADRTVNTGEPVMQDNLPGELAYQIDVAGLGKLGVWKR